MTGTGKESTFFIYGSCEPLTYESVDILVFVTKQNLYNLFSRNTR